jgi:hypothetical protein
MSVGGLVDLAVARGKETPKRRNRYVSADDTSAATPVALGVLLTIIPVELVALYTAFIVGTTTRITPSDQFLANYKTQHKTDYPYTYTRDLAGWRWAVYLILALTAIGIVYQGWSKKRESTDNRKFPISEAFAGAAAFAVWGLVMPGGLLGSYVAKDNLNTVTLAITVIAAAILIGLGMAVLKEKANKTD